MSFNNTKVKRLAKNLALSEEQTVSLLLKQAKYLKVSGNLLLKSYVILNELKTESNEKQAQELKEKSRYKTKNLIISKYMDVIIKLYQEGTGAINISKYLKLNHKVTISKSAIDNFLKTNEVKRNG
ncbi:hypothetical protein AACT_1247 [Arcobacter acticola]|uniref:Uncharacterized protein n=1 Tax=Arcobacter acticola TaxID=1849015 RepID=A0A6M8EG43_9BACT|nr:hypothetical protein [Arcobacter acticola]QKE28426.1 hypothetical protein AACT_1247 [Arcobacter acticola]